MSDDGYFDADVAAGYDDESPEMPAAAIALLAGLAGGGRALEFAIGTGRVALPLAARGVEVHGIDLSRAMVARLRAKPGGDAIGVTVGDFTATTVPGDFALVYLVFNTVMNVTSQDGQVEIFRNAAAHLTPGGVFLVETMVPELRRLPPGQRAVPFLAGGDVWAYDLYDTATQAMSSNYTDARGRRSIPFRYVWPAELDLMARIAGLRLRERWAGWDRAPFTHESTSHVSVWEKA